MFHESLYIVLKKSFVQFLQGSSCTSFREDFYKSFKIDFDEFSGKICPVFLPYRFGTTFLRRFVCTSVQRRLGKYS